MLTVAGMRSTVNQLRSAAWYDGQRPQRLHPPGLDAARATRLDALDGTKPQIAIANTASDLTPCNMHLNEVAESVKHGVWEAGGVPYNLPVVSLGETQVKPTAMLWRNMAAMAMEEMFRANPIDGVVLLGGCDKTIPALLMAAASVDLPAIVVPGGPMLTGHFRGEALGCGTDVWRLSEEVRAGTLSTADFTKSEGVDDPQQGPLQHDGHGVDDGGGRRGARDDDSGLRGNARLRTARLLTKSHETGRLIVEMIEQGRRPSDIMTRESFLNAIVAVAAVGGSTNSVMHLLAIAGRLGIDLDLDDFDEAGRDVPLLVEPAAVGAVPDGRPATAPAGCSRRSRR